MADSERSRGSELLVGFGERISDDELSEISETKKTSEKTYETEEKPNNKRMFFDRFKGKDRRLGMTRYGSGSVDSQSSKFSTGSLSKVKNNVGKVLKKLNTHNQLLSPVVFFDLESDHTPPCDSSYAETKQPNLSLRYEDSTAGDLQLPTIVSVGGGSERSSFMSIQNNSVQTKRRENTMEPMSPQQEHQSEYISISNKPQARIEKEDFEYYSPEKGKDKLANKGIAQQTSDEMDGSDADDLEHEISSPQKSPPLPLHKELSEASIISYQSGGFVVSNQNPSHIPSNQSGTSLSPDYIPADTKTYPILEESIGNSKRGSVISQKRGSNVINPKTRARNNININPSELQQYTKKIVQKSEATKQMIYDAIKSNILFILWSKDEILEFVDTFDEVLIKEGETIFTEGDEGTYFYVLDSGSVSVYRQSNLAGTIDGTGSTFGDVALLYDAPRNATFRAVTDCKLWVIDRKDYRGISRLNNKSKADKKITFLKEVKVGNHILGDVLEMSEIYNIALATQTVSFAKGDYIIKEGDKGDAFYIIKSGYVDVYIKACGKDPIGTMNPGQFIGEKALIEESGIRTATCVAVSDDVECLLLEREDFVKMLGDVKWMFEKVYDREQHILNGNKPKDSIEEKKSEETSLSFKLSDFEIKRTIGIGAFGSVKLVKSTSICPDKRNTTYVLKCQDLKLIEENNMMEHIRSEQKIMEELNHPFIIKFYGELVDSHFTYFLLELLQGGEIFRLLLENIRFPESWSRFYSGVVLLAFSEIHINNFVYRDLKPENLVLDAKGYPKIVDFGLAKKLEGGKTWTLCGTPDYMPPEVILNEGHDSAADYWSVGILLFEFCNGSPPFNSEYPMDVYKNILSGKIEYPPFFSPQLIDLIKKLLNPRQATRIGRTYGGTKQIMDQKWFKSLNFEDLLQGKIDPPFVPELEDEDDMRYFYDYAEIDGEQEEPNQNLEIEYEDPMDDEEDDEDEEQQEQQQQQDVQMDTTSRKPTVTFINSETKSQKISLISTISKSSRKKSYVINRKSRNTQQNSETNENMNGSTDGGLSQDSSYAHGPNGINPIQDKKTKADSFLMIQLMNLALSENISEHSINDAPFRQFSLLSVVPETLYDIACSDGRSYEYESIIFNGTRYIDPIYMNSVDVVDSFPKEKKMKRRGSASHLAPEALAAFCFPDGLSVRLLPRSAVEGAKRLQWIGPLSDKYQLHAFTNGSGDRSYGVAITIREEIFCTDDDAISVIVDFLKVCRYRRRAARIISECWRRYVENREISNDHLPSPNNGARRNLFSRAISYSNKHQENMSSNLVGRMKNTLMRTHSSSADVNDDYKIVKQNSQPSIPSSWRFEEQSIKQTKPVSRQAQRLAAEAYKFMVEAESVGEICILEHCYVMIGTKPEEQSLILNALQKVIQVEREDKVIRMRFSTPGDLMKNDSTLVSDNRNAILQAMQTKLRLSPEDVKKTFSGRNEKNVFEVDLLLGNSSRISLPLPLPHISAQWGFATLIRSIKCHNILIALKLLLMERSILLVGTKVEEVSASACAMLELLKPFKWASAFMPLLPVKLLDIVESPVPFIGGIVINDEVNLDMLEHDDRVQNAMEDGLSIINLTRNTFSPTSEEGVIDFMKRCYDPISHELLYYQSKLLTLAKNKNSALNSFKTFFEVGPSPQEAETLDSMRDIFEDHFRNLSCISKPDDYKQFGVFDPETDEFDFFPDKFLEPLRAQLEFQEAMIGTQLFLSYIEEKKNILDLLEGPSARLIADWVYFRWTRRKHKKKHKHFHRG